MFKEAPKGRGKASKRIKRRKALNTKDQGIRGWISSY
jgi:hypothetical protein